MALTPKVKLQANISFPANVSGRTGIDVIKQNGNYFIDLAFHDFAPPVAAIPDAAHQNALLWNTVTGSYVLAPVSLLAGSGGGISEAPNDGQQYGRQSLGWTPVVSGGGGVTSIGGQNGVITLNGGALASKELAAPRYDVAQTLTAPQQAQARQNIGVGLRGWLAGLALSTAGASASFSVAVGEAADSTNAAVMTLAAAITKTTATWAVGSGNGALDTGAIANSTWYHAHLIRRPDTGVVDILVSLSPTAPTLPANYTLFRRIGSMKTNASSQWTGFVQDGDTFNWNAPVNDVTSTLNPGTAAVTRTVSTPLGVRVEGIFFTGFGAPATTDNPAAILLSDLSIADTTPIVQIGSFYAYSSSAIISNTGGVVRVFTNTASQIRSRLQLSGANTQLFITTFGWVDRRGRDG